MATSFAVDLIFKSQGGGKLRELSNQLQGVDANSKSAQRGLDGSSRAMRNVDTSARTAAGGVSKLSGAVKGLLGGFALLQGAKFVFGAAAGIERTQKQLQTLTGSANNARIIFEELQRVNKQSPFKLEELTGAAAKLSAFGVPLQDLVGTTERLGKISAGTGQDIEGIALAYGQVLAKGRLQTEELLQFQERGIPLQKELAKQMGVTEAEVSDLITKGKVGFPQVKKAVEALTGETGRFGKAFENTAGTIDAKLSNMEDAFYRAAGALGKAFEPIFKWLIEQFTNLFNMIDTAISRFNGVSKLTPERVGQLRDQAGRDANKKYGAFNLSGDKSNFFNSQLDTYIDNEIKKSQGGNKLTGTTPAPTPSPTPGPSSSGGGSKGNGDAERAAKEAEQRRKELVDLAAGNALLRQQNELQNQILNAKLAGSKEAEFDLEFQKRLLEGDAKIAEITRNEADLKKRALLIDEERLNTAAALRELTYGQQQAYQDQADTFSDMLGDLNDQIALQQAGSEELRTSLELEQRLAKLRKENPWMTNEQIEKLRAANKELDEATRKANALNIQQEQMNNLLNGMGGQFKGLFDTLIQGTNDWNAVLSDTLRQFSSLLFSAGLGMLDGGDGKGFFSFLNGGLGKRARGGPVSSGTPYLVGEKGPELFVPGRSGGIVPNDQLGGDGVNVGNIQIVNNIDGSGDTKSDSKKGAELGRMMQSAVIGVLLQERRPGGILAR